MQMQEGEKTNLMRYLIILITCCSFFFPAKAQMYYLPMSSPDGLGRAIASVPPEVAVEFKLNYPKIRNVYWKREFDTTYMAVFSDSTVINVNYSPAGNRKYTEILLPLRQIPPAVSKDITTRYKGWTVLTARLIIDSRGDKIYSALVQRGDRNNSYDLTYNTNGRFVCSSPPLPKILQ